MEPLPPNTAVLPPTLRAIALSLLIETVLPWLNHPAEGCPELKGAGGPEGEDELWQLLQRKCDELSALVLRANQPGEAAGYVLRYLPKHFDYVFEQLFGRKRLPVLDRFDSGQQGQANGGATKAESWDSPFEPRRTNGSLRDGPPGTQERWRGRWQKPTSPNAVLPPPSEFHPGP